MCGHEAILYLQQAKSAAIQSRNTLRTRKNVHRRQYGQEEDLSFYH